MGERGYERRRAALLYACVFFASVGLALAFAGEALFGWWGAVVSRPEGIGRFTDGILGGSIVGKWVAAAWLVAVPLRRRERWAAVALLASHLAWFVIDSAASVRAGVPENVRLINLLPGVLVTGLVLSLWSGTRAVAAPPRSRARLALTAVCAVSISTGLASAFAFESPIFDLYRAAIVERYGDVTGRARLASWWRFVFGPIGGAIAGQFVALTAIAWRERSPRAVAAIAIGSMLAWFVVDSTIVVLERAWFNLYLVNVPSLLLVLAPALILAREEGGDPGVS